MSMHSRQQRPSLLVLLLLLLPLDCFSAVISSSKTQQTTITTGSSSSSSSTTAAAASPPSFCYHGSSAAYPNADHQTTMSRGGNLVKVYHNLYHHNRRWYALVNSSSSSSSSGIDAGMSINTQLVELPTTDSKAFQDNIQVCYVPGVTLLIDFPFPAFPDNLGHWAELLLPTFSVFSNPAWTNLLHQPPERYNITYNSINRILLVNIKPEILYNWPKEMLALAIDSATPPWPLAAAEQQQQQDPAAAAAAARRPQLPPGVVPWDKPLPQLLGYANITSWCAHSWMLFENMVVIQDRYHILSMPDRKIPETPADVMQQHNAPAAAAAAAAAAAMEGLGNNALWQGFWKTAMNIGFNKPSLAQRFRQAAFARHLWRPPHFKQQQQQQQQSDVSSSSGSNANLPMPPRVVTVLLYPEDYPPVTNHHALVALLRNVTKPFGFKVRTVSLTMGAPFLSHMATASDTGLLIARHGPLLATAVLLPPGAAVLELLPYKWEWRDVSSLYYNMTQSTGVLHHWAWRPLDAKFCNYKESSHARYSSWTPSECHGRECLLVHAQAGLEVDLEAVRELLERKLPLWMKGACVQQLREPWPPAE